MKKDTVILLAVAGVSGYHIYREMNKSSKGTVTVESPEIITEQQYTTQESSLPDNPLLKAAPGILQKVTDVFKRVKAKKQLKKLQSGTTTAKTKKKLFKKKKVAGFDEMNILY